MSTSSSSAVNKTLYDPIAVAEDLKRQMSELQVLREKVEGAERFAFARDKNRGSEELGRYPENP
jgi:hypothetical protein